MQFKMAEQTDVRTILNKAVEDTEDCTKKEKLEYHRKLIEQCNEIKITPK